MGEKLNKLKELRSIAKIPQKELAEYLGITVAAYSLYERGDREPNITILKKLADYYGVSVDYLMDRECTNPDPDDSWAMKNFVYQNVYDIIIRQKNLSTITDEEVQTLKLFCDFCNKMEEIKKEKKENTEN